MRSLLRKTIFLAVLGSLVFMGWTDLRPQPAYAEQFCQTNGRRCFTEGQQFYCIFLGCCGYIGSGSCQCVEGYWNCPVPPECPPDFCP